MGQVSKFLVTDERTYDLSAYRWDDHMLSDLLIKKNDINSAQALDISRSLKEDIHKMAIHTITIPLLEQIVEAKLLEFGITKTTPIKLDSSMLVKEDLELSENAKTVLDRRYLKKDREGNTLEKPTDLFRRVAHHIALAENRYPDGARTDEVEELFYRMMTEFKFLPNSPTLMNAGRRLGQLAACFVLPIEDSMDGIFDSLKNAALIHKSGGGTGFSFSRLRPKDSRVGTTGGIASGPVSFMKIFNTATEQVKQGGTRRGANMAILDISHPDIIDFIQAKSDLRRWQNFNVSVSITDEWMGVLETRGDKQHEVYHPEWGKGLLWTKSDKIKAFRLEDSPAPGPDGEITWYPWTVQDTWNLIYERAWQTGEPGLLFIDRVNEDNPIDHLGQVEACNPCGEQPLLPFESCTLGSINLAKFYHEPDPGCGFIDWSRLKDTIHIAVRFLDNVIDVNKYPLPEIELTAKRTRRIGLGVMGWADLLFKANIAYDSEEALALAEEVGKFFQATAKRASEDLVLQEGRSAYPSFDKDKNNLPIRNSYRTTVAPTGTLSILAGCSSGIEPLFALAFKRQVLVDVDGNATELDEVNPWFERAVNDSNLPVDRKDGPSGLLQWVRCGGSIKDYIEDLGEDGGTLGELTRVFKTAHDIDPKAHVAMQAAWQEHTDASISKTINLPRDCDNTAIDDIYWDAYFSGCKGVTVYRDGCRDGDGQHQPMVVEHGSTNTVDPDLASGNGKAQEQKEAPADLEVLPAGRTKLKTQYGTLHVIVTHDPSTDAALEIFAQLGKNSDVIAADLEGMCRIASLYLRDGGTLDAVIDQWQGIGSSHVMPSAEGKIKSIADALAKALKKYVAHRSGQATGKADTLTDLVETNYRLMCPSCNKGALVFQEGCRKCPGCGFSEC